MKKKKKKLLRERKEIYTNNHTMKTEKVVCQFSGAYCV